MFQMCSYFRLCCEISQFNSTLGFIYLKVYKHRLGYINDMMLDRAYTSPWIWFTIWKNKISKQGKNIALNFFLFVIYKRSQTVSACYLYLKKKRNGEPNSHPIRKIFFFNQEFGHNVMAINLCLVYSYKISLQNWNWSNRICAILKNQTGESTSHPVRLSPCSPIRQIKICFIWQLRIVLCGHKFVLNLFLHKHFIELKLVKPYSCLTKKSHMVS